MKCVVYSRKEWVYHDFGKKIGNWDVIEILRVLDWSFFEGFQK